jgi:hypothetical protein
MTPHNYEIVDCGAFCKVVFFCISPKNLLGDFFDSLSSYCNLKKTGNTSGIEHEFLMADDAKQTELKSGLVADPAWDFDYATMFSRPICEVNVKEKPLEVASVEKKRKTT